MTRLAPLLLTVKSKRAYELLVDQIRILAGMGIRVPCSFKPSMWDIDAKSKIPHEDKYYQQQIANSAVRQCINHCTVLTYCDKYRKTGAIRSGILAGKWIGASKNKLRRDKDWDNSSSS